MNSLCNTELEMQEPWPQSEPWVVWTEVKKWLAAHAEILHDGWTVKEVDDDRYIHWSTTFSPFQAGDPLVSVDVYLNYTCVRICGTTVCIRHRSRRVGKEGVEMDRQHYVQRVIKFLEDVVNDRVQVILDQRRGRTIRWRVFRASSKRWHRIYDHSAWYANPFAKNPVEIVCWSGRRAMDRPPR